MRLYMSRCSMHIVKGKKQVDAGIRESFSTGHIDVLHLKWIHGTCIRAILHGTRSSHGGFLFHDGRVANEKSEFLTVEYL